MIVVVPEEYIDQLLYLRPGYDWGWHGADARAPVDYATIYAAGGCHVRVLRFFSWRNEVRGVVGRVEEAGHLFDGLWIVCGEMRKGEHDFTTRLCWRYDLELGRSEPDAGEWPYITQRRTYAGYGVLARSAQDIEAAREKWGPAALEKPS